MNLLLNDKPTCMRAKVLVPTVTFFLLFVSACQKEITPVGSESPTGETEKVDTLPHNYPFANGYCNNGTSLGISIVDTAIYSPDSASALPNSLILDMPAPRNQGSQKSCTAWATVYAAGSYYHHIASGKPYSDTTSLNPAFTYNQITLGNCGCTPFLDHLYLLKTQGACSFVDMGYSDTDCTMQPDSGQRKRAENYKINGWQKVNLHNPTIIKRAIFEKRPVLFAITTDEGFRHLVAPYIWKKSSGSVGETHAMLVVGYDDTKKAFRIMNSWSAGWADKGFAWIDYDYFVANVLERGYIII
jgi:C1A family cysteine protease